MVLSHSSDRWKTAKVAKCISTEGWSLALFLFNEQGTDCSFHRVLKCQEWESVDHTENTISRSACKWAEGGWGSTRQTCVAPHGPCCIRAVWAVQQQFTVSVCPSRGTNRWSLCSLGVKQMPVLAILLLPYSASHLHSCSLSVFPPLCVCIFSFPLHFIPLLLSIPSTPFEGAVAARQPSYEETLKCGQREGNLVARQFPEEAS